MINHMINKTDVIDIYDTLLIILSFLIPNA